MSIFFVLFNVRLVFSFWFNVVVSWGMLLLVVVVVIIGIVCCFGESGLVFGVLMFVDVL